MSGLQILHRVVKDDYGTGLLLEKDEYKNYRGCGAALLACKDDQVIDIFYVDYGDDLKNFVNKNQGCFFLLGEMSCYEARNVVLVDNKNFLEIKNKLLSLHRKVLAAWA